MKLLIVHQNFPGQFRHLAQTWAARPGWEVIGLGRETTRGAVPGVRLIRYKLQSGNRDAVGVHPYLRRAEEAVLHGQAAARAMRHLAQQGFRPDVILAHPGWGETLYARDVFPQARLVHLCEWYYQTDGADLGFDPQFPVSADDRARVRTWNAIHALNLTQCDAGVAPTRWQRDQHPPGLREQLQVQHEGIALQHLKPDSRAVLRMPSGAMLRAGDPVVTYVARNLEPYRGFHVFLKMLERLQQADRRVHAIIVGGDGVSYGRAAPGGGSWREHLLKTVRLDPQRTHFLGRVPYGVYVRVLQLSAAHVYLTYPFVLSWSMLEAMACGAPVLGSDTPPVREVITHGRNGLLTAFFDVGAMCDLASDMLAQPGRHAQIRIEAAKTACTFSREAGLHGYDRLIQADRYMGGPQEAEPALDLQASIFQPLAVP